jgi:uncharacterized protein (DUF2236 family)
MAAGDQSNNGPRAPAIEQPNDGYFPPDSMIWRVSREPLLLLGGGRALLMQVAHPLVAAGVAEHSDYRESPWRRLERTMSAVWSIVYGTKAEADRAAERVRNVHSRVHGRLADGAGPYPSGTSYSAADPDLLMWVHGTLVDTALLVYEGWVRPLGDHERERYYGDMKVLAGAFGTPQSVIPPTFADFRAYMREHLEGDGLAVTSAALDVKRSILDEPPLPPPLRPLWTPVGLVTAGLLPPVLREQYGVAWDRARGALLESSRATVRHVVLPLLPALVRAIPAARSAERRARRLGHAGRAPARRSLDRLLRR